MEKRININGVNDWRTFSITPSSEREIRERVIRNQESVCYSYLCKYQKLSESFIIELAVLSTAEYIPETAEEYLEWIKAKKKEFCGKIRGKYRNRLDWSYISQYQQLSEKFIKHFEKYLDMKLISTYQKLSDDYIRSNFRYLDPYALYNNQDIKDEKIIKKIKKYIEKDKVIYHKEAK